MTITPLPPAPNRTDPATFSDRADNFVAALSTLVTEINAIPGTDATNVSITGGTINGTVIGGSTPAAISGTTGSFSGNVGIGTTSPASNLSVFGTAHGSSGFSVGTDGSPSGGLFNAGTASRSIRISADDANAGVNSVIAFSVDNTERLRITSAGNVGIGTSSPTTKLDIDTGSASATALTMQAAAATSAKLSLGLGMFSAGVPTVLGTANGLDLGTSASAPVRFFTNNTERARIDASGNLLVGTTGVIFGNSGSADGTSIYGSVGRVVISANDDRALELRRRTTNGQIAQFYRDTTQVGNISVTTTATSFNTSSDYRLKEDVQPLVGASDRVLSLKPCNFAWKADGSRVDGFLAHEAQEIVPAAVTGEKDGEEMQAIDHSKLVPLLTAALQEALKRIEALEAQLT